MAPWKLPLIVAGLVIPIVGGFLVAGPGLGMALGALAVVALVAIAVRERPRGPIASAPAQDDRRHVLLVAAGADPADVARIVSAAGLDGTNGETEVLVLVPAQIGFLDRWASDVEAARHGAQQHLVATVAALAKVGIAAEARVGDEDVVQATEDQLQSYPATEVVLAGAETEDTDDAAAELRSRLQADFHHVRLNA
jgi:hypothetical protein